MAIHERAGKDAQKEDIIDIIALIDAYYRELPYTKGEIDSAHKISFGTSGHRGKAFEYSFNECHIMAISQAICDIRRAEKIEGKLFLGMDTHALSLPAYKTCIEVLVANEVYVAIQEGEVGKQYTPTPVISHAILNANKTNKTKNTSLCDGIIITPSHNPPSDGGFKYNPPHGGPADTSITKRIEDRANNLLLNNNKDVKSIHFDKAITSKFILMHDYISEYVGDLDKVIDMQAISQSAINIGVDPLYGSSMQYWEPIAQKYNINITLISEDIDSTFKNVPLDHDGKIRMDCSSAYVMKNLLAYKHRFDISFATDPDADRHGIVSFSGLVPANHFLAVASDYLLQNRPQWKPFLEDGAQIGKTIVTSTMLDKVAKSHNSSIYEVPVGFKYFVQPLLEKKCVFACEESAGASFLCFDGSAWSTDKDGILLCLLSAEIMAKTGKNPSKIYKELEDKHGKALYTRVDSKANAEIKKAFKEFSEENISATTLANEPIQEIINKTKGNKEKFGGFKIQSANSWFAARPSGTEDICKVYIESYLDKDDFEKLKEEAIEIVNNLIR